MAAMENSFSVATIDAGLGPIPVAVVGEIAYNLGEVLPGIRMFADLFESWDANLDHISARLSDSDALATVESFRVSEVEFLPPVQPIGTVFAAGANYREHVLQLSVAHRLGRADATEAELRSEAAAEIDERARTGDPYVWVGVPSAVSGANDDVQLPEIGGDVDWELELGVIIGKAGYRISVGDAEQHIAGYTICNDLTARSLVPRTDIAMMGTDWFRAKNAPGFFPTGPYVRPARFVEDVSQLRIELKLNGEVKQEGDPGDLLFTVPQLISYVSTFVRIQPGDMLITGSPPGNGSHWGRFLQDGDVMESTITGLGVQRNVVRGRDGVRPAWYADRDSTVFPSA